MFTVIIPLYNKAAYVEKAIRSVLNQTYQEFELIVVDDGSTDESLKNLRFTIYDLQLPEEKIRIIEQENQGVSTTRNNGVKLANYDYIAFLDADDWWEPTYLEEMKGLIERHPYAGIYASSYYKAYKDKLVQANIGVDAGFTEGEINYCRVYAKTMYQPVWTGATIIKKDIFKSENGFKPRLKLGEDFDLWVRVALKYPVVLLNKSLAYYNQDVELANRAIGEKLYLPEEHMLFSDYLAYSENEDFRMLFEVLAIYSLLPYYLSKKNKNEYTKILNEISWKNHSFKYFIYYRILPRIVLKIWLKSFKFAYTLKKQLKSQ